MLRVVMGIVALVVLPLLASSSSFAAEGLNCEYYATQEEAQSTYDRYDHTKLILDPDGNGIACEELPSLATIVPESLRSAYNARTQGGDDGNEITVAPKIEVTLVGLAPRVFLPNDIVCPDTLTENPVEDLVKFDANVFVTSASGKHVSEATQMVDDGILWVWDGEEEPVNVNVWLVANGFGVWDSESTPDDMRVSFSTADAEARQQKRGVWGDCSVERNHIVTRFAPQSLQDRIDRVATLSGSWGDSGTFEIPQDGTYTVTVRAANANSYIEIAVIRNIATGQEYPEFYWTLFGPDTYVTQVYFPAGTYLFDCRAAGSWNFAIDTLPSE